PPCARRGSSFGRSRASSALVFTKRWMKSKLPEAGVDFFGVMAAASGRAAWLVGGGGAWARPAGVRPGVCVGVFVGQAAEGGSGFASHDVCLPLGERTPSTSRGSRRF